MADQAPGKEPGAPAKEPGAPAKEPGAPAKICNAVMVLTRLTTHRSPQTGIGMDAAPRLALMAITFSVVFRPWPDDQRGNRARSQSVVLPVKRESQGIID